MNLYSQLPEFAPFDMLLSFESWHVLHLLYTWLPPCSTSTMPKYDLYQRIALGGFSMPCVGSAQRHWLHHSTYLRGDRVWALRCSTLQGDRHCATSPRPPRLVRPEFRVLGFSWARVSRVSRPSGVDKLLRPQPYSGGSLSIRVVSGRDPTRLDVAGTYGPPLGVSFAS
jgi:hypothetical protein